VVDTHAGFSRPIQEIVRLAREHGTKVILVEMPMPSRHREVFYASPVWSQMRAYLQKLAAADGASYVAASDWVHDDAKFEDATHLNEAGAKVFSSELARAVARLELGHPPAQVASGR
jgi:hypothetical protein